MSEQSQTAKLIAVMAECLPEMSVSQRQKWIKDTKGMKDLLTKLVELRWTEENGVITFTLPPTDGTTGEQWIKCMEKEGNRVGDQAKQVLLSEGFKPTTGVVYTVKVLKGAFFSDNVRTTKNIRAEANKRKFSNLNAEAACLIRVNFMDEELEAMDLLYIVVMDESIKYSDTPDLRLLGLSRIDTGRWLGSSVDYPDDSWDRGGGFAFSAT